MPTSNRDFPLARTIAPCVLSLWLLFAADGVHADASTEVREYASRGDLPAALRRIEQAVAAEPRDVSLRFLHGVVLMDSTRDDQALALFTQMTQDHPDLPDPYNNLGLLHARAGRLDQAMAAVQGALRAEPSHRVARANLGQLHLMLAIRTWEELSKSGPVDASLLKRLDTARALVGGSLGVAGAGGR